MTPSSTWGSLLITGILIVLLSGSELTLAQDGLDNWQRQLQAADKASLEGRFGDAEAILAATITDAVKIDAHSAQLFLALSALANVLARQGKHTAAEPLLRQALTIRESVLGTNDPAVAESLHLLAQNQRAQRKFIETERLLRQAERIVETSPSTPARVGNLGDPERLSFVGTSAFSENALRNGLLDDPDLHLASHPFALLHEDYLTAVRDSILRGYHAAGFPDVALSATHDTQTGRIVVSITEGSRYRAGDVVVQGARTAPADEIARRLTEGYPPAVERRNLVSGLATQFLTGRAGDSGSSHRSLRGDGTEVTVRDPEWTPGDPARFGPATVADITDAVTSILADLGYLFPKVDVRVMPDRDTAVAKLVVDIRDEGTRGVVESIEITGARRNRQDDIVSYLGLRPGASITQSVLGDVERRLWQAARFRSFNVTARVLEPGTPKMAVAIDLNEERRAPPLSEDFSRRARALLKLRDWLATGIADRGHDFIISVRGQPNATSPLNRGDAEVIVSSRGLLIQGGAVPRRGVRQAYALVVTDGQVGVFSPLRSRKWTVPVTESQVAAQLAWMADTGSDEAYVFRLGGFISTRKPGTSAFQLVLQLPPVAFGSASGFGYKATFARGLAIVSGGSCDLTLEEQTGRLIDYRCKPDHDRKVAVTVRAEPGAFARVWQQLQTATQQHHDAGDASSPLGSLAGFVVEEAVAGGLIPSIASLPETRRVRAAAVLRKLFAHRPLEPLDALWLKLIAPEDRDFRVPPNRPDTMQAAANNAVSRLSVMVLRGVETLFAKRSWPWTLAREAVFVVDGRSPFTGLELERLYDSVNTGPLGFLTTAALLARIDSPDARMFAERGLERLSTSEFRKDARLLIEGGSALAHTTLRLLDAVRELSPDDLDAVCALLPTRTADAARSALQRIPQTGATPATDVILAALDELWEKDLRTRAAAALRTLASR